MTVVSGNEAFIIFHMTIRSTLLAKVRFDHPNVALDALQRTPLLR